MTSRSDPVDQARNGEAVDKVEESGVAGKRSRDSETTDGLLNAPAVPNVTFDLISSAKLLDRLEKSLASQPAIDGIRVLEIKSAIEKGEYKIDSKAIADAIIRLERSFGE